MATQKVDQNGFQDRLAFNAGQKHCRMLQGEHSAILSTCTKLPFVIKIFVLSIFEWPLKTGFTVYVSCSLKPYQVHIDHRKQVNKSIRNYSHQKLMQAKFCFTPLCNE